MKSVKKALASPRARLMAGCAILALAGECQFLLTLVRWYAIGLPIVLVAVVAAYVLWRPSWVMVGLLVGVLGLEALIGVQNGASRFFDWDLHYQMSRVFAGLPLSNGLFLPFLSQRTALMEALIAAVLVHAPSYAVFQVGSVVLNMLWLWPAGLLLERWGRPQGYVVVALCCPVVVANMIFTWPWGLCAFWILAAIYFLEGEAPTLRGYAAAGGCCAGAVMTHEGCIGYALAIVVWTLWRVRGSAKAVAFVASGMVWVTVLGVPWALDINRLTPVVGIITHSTTLTGDSSVFQWVVGRALVIVASIVPLNGASSSLDIILTLMLNSVIGALAILWVARSRVRPQGLCAAVIVGGLVGGMLLQPFANVGGGLNDTAFIAALVYFVECLGQATPSTWKRLRVFGPVIGLVVAAFIVYESWTLPSPNTTLVTSEHLAFLSHLSLVPGVILTLAGVMVLGLSWRQWWGARPVEHPPAA